MNWKIEAFIAIYQQAAGLKIRVKLTKKIKTDIIK